MSGRILVEFVDLCGLIDDRSTSSDLRALMDIDLGKW